MKKFLPYILIFLIVVQLFAPFTVGTGVKNNIEIQKNTAHAADDVGFSVTTSATGSTLSSSVSLVGGSGEAILYNFKTNSSYKIEIELKDNSGILIDSDSKLISSQTQYPIILNFEGLKELTTYNLNLILREVTTIYDIDLKRDITLSDTILINKSVPVTTLSADTTTPLTVSTQTVGAAREGDPTPAEDGGALPACYLLSGDGFKGCIAQGFYYVFFIPTSFVFALSGKILDFTFWYSISDESYRSSFVVEGWGILKDFSNMFFIFVLLYIAFGTILNLHSVKTKEMIINVVIIGLLINFSLFTTQVVIDASNILARVFYNNKTIVTGSAQTDANGNALPVESELGSFGEIKLSEAIVSKVNPQKLIISSGEVSKVSPASRGLNTNENNKDEAGNNISIGSFIIVVLLSSAVNVVGTIAFASSALIFIGRVVMLWLSMIVAPLAFFSYIVPSLQDIKMVGWKKWWPDLLNMAFVAPIFAFFMYIIVAFLGKGLDVVSAAATTGAGGLNFVIATLVPFAFIMVLLMKAKSVAVDMSGEIGASLSRAGGVVGGLAVGAMTGGAALAMRGTVGRLGSAVASSDRLKSAEEKGGIGGFAAKMLLKTGTAAGKGSFDARATKAGASAAKSLGVDLGKAKEGGFAKARAEHVEKRQKRVRELEVGEDSKLKQDFYAAQDKLDKEKSSPANQLALSTATTDLATEEKNLVLTERSLVSSERALKDAIDRFGANSGAAGLARVTRNAAVSARDLQAINVDDARGTLKRAEDPIKIAEKNVKAAENAIISKNRTTRENYAASNRGGWSQAVNFVVSGGQHSFRGEREASNKILAGIKDEKK